MVEIKSHEHFYFPNNMQDWVGNGDNSGGHSIGTGLYNTVTF